MQDKQKKASLAGGAAVADKQGTETLDGLSAKLLKSEIDREKLQKLLEEAMDSQDRLENQLERSHIDIQRRIDSLETEHNHEATDKTFYELLDVQRELIEKLQSKISKYDSQQIIVEDKINDNNHAVSKLQRRLDAQEQKRARLERRIQRVENIANDAQNALNAKALVLLTDKSEAVKSALPYTDADVSADMVDTTLPVRATSHQDNKVIDVNDMATGDDQSNWVKIIRPIGFVSSFAVAVALGWFLATQMPAGLNQTQTIDNDSGLLATSHHSIEEDIALLSTDWITQDILNQAMDSDFSGQTSQSVANPQIGNALNDELLSAPDFMNTLDDTIVTPQITMDRDGSLPESVQALEGKAFDGIAEAQHDMAALYVSGQAGVTQNYERAIQWFELAARQGIANAAYNLGVMYQQGMGVDLNVDRALNWYRSAALLNHAEAKYNLGIAYIEGIGAPYNPDMAAAYFKNSALGGIAEAAYNLGLILENGILGSTRVNDALFWYRMAADEQNQDAVKAFEKLSMTLGVDQAEAGLLSDGTSLATMMVNDADNQSVNNLSETQLIEVDPMGLLPNDQTLLVMEVQEQLRQMDFYDGALDGTLNAQTTQAIKAYQIKEDLPVDGAASQSLYASMLADH